MNKYGRTIKLFLIDGSPDGRMACELSNWTGKAIKIPRKQIKESNDRFELQGTGIYILFGKSEKNESKESAYIGEAEEVKKRLSEHLSSKDFWNTTIVFTSKDENLNKAHIKYIENRLYHIAKAVNRYDLVNSNKPTKPKISESDQAEMEEFIDNIKLLVNTLGYNIFEELVKVNLSKEEEINSVFYIKAARGANAKGQVTNEGFVVLKGSSIAISTTSSFPKNWLKLRNTLIEKKIIVKENEQLDFKENYLFSSPSAAAAIVMGRSANGLTEWKTLDGRILKMVEKGN